MNELGNRINSLVERLQQIRDEVEVQIHLARAEAKTEWEKLEHKRNELESQAREIGDTIGTSSRQVASALELALEEVKQGYERIKQQLNK